MQTNYRTSSASYCSSYLSSYHDSSPSEMDSSSSDDYDSIFHSMEYDVTLASPTASLTPETSLQNVMEGPQPSNIHDSPDSSSYGSESSPLQQPAYIDFIESHPGVTLGKGSYGTVKAYTVNHQGEDLSLALKKPVSSNPKACKTLNDEIRLLRNLNHPNIIAMFMGIESMSQPVLVMARLHNDLFDWLANEDNEDIPDLESARQILSGFLAGMSYLHETACIHHNDLHTPNILLKSEVNGSLSSVITDFGLSTKAGDNSIMLSRDTRFDPWHLKSGSTARDIYSIGYIACCVLSGSPRLRCWAEHTAPGKETIYSPILFHLPPDCLIANNIQGTDRLIATDIISQIAFPSMVPDKAQRMSATELKARFDNICTVMPLLGAFNTTP
ncbi:protein kinase family protein [Sansalvadorimonas verongulae]|uniref:protein kinase family protein n=1 Tax=Sansalvadorimonas verongulae TaxID=2172824 RepID=UPI0012BCA376|nr:protein kinase family protein [Sansalvadorimonas verongulae]MTI12290.1 protein kinase family protein [Sansalvadorimonas verongulae]